MHDLSTTRHQLTLLLERLAGAPELLLHDHVVEHLERSIVSYQHVYESISSEVLSREPHQSKTDDSLQERDAADVKDTHSAPTQANMSTLDPPSSFAPPTQPAPERDEGVPKHGGVSQGTLVLVNQLPELFDVLDHGLDGRHIIEKLDRLEAWSLRDEYLALHHGRQVELAHYLVARLRHVQDALGHYDAQSYMGRFRALANGIKDLFHSPPHDVGFIYGLRRADPPAHGATWEEDARHWREALLAHLTPPEERSQQEHTAQKTSKSSTSRSLKLAPIPAPLKAFAPALRGARILCVGGIKKAHQLDNLEAWFEPASLAWVESEQEKGVRHVQRECNRIAAGRYDVVCLFLRALSHAESDMLIRACKQSVHGVHRVCIETGFGPGAWLEGLERASPPLRVDTEEE